MDFTNRTSRPQQTGDGPANSDSSLSGVKNTKPGRQGVFGKFRQHALLNISYLALLLSITVVIVGVVLALFFFEGNREDKLIDSSKHQAVFLDNGQVYFGNITDLNKGFLTLSNIYYLRVNQQVQPGKQAGQNDVSLVKLGCELHGPQDTMVINKEQITFWENLKDDGQVAGAIAEYVKANPNGQDCSQQQQQQSSGTSESTNSGGTSTGTNSTNTTDNTDSSDTSTDAGTDDQNSAPTSNQ